MRHLRLLMIRKTIHYLSAKWRRFLEGPGWIHETHGLNFVFKYYRSPTLKLLHWAMAWYDRMFSWSARFLLIIFFFSFFFSVLSLRSPVIIVFLFLLVLLVSDLVVGWIFFPRLKILRRMPKRVKCSVPFTIQYDVKNLRRVYAYDVEMEPNITLPHLQRFENPRIFSFPPKTETRISMKMVATRRGIMPVTRGIAESCFPFNLFKHGSVFGSEERLMVHPQTCKIHGMLSLGGSSNAFHAGTSVASTGESMDFYGCRQYQPGDSMRKIHWRATARLNKPIMKEFQKEEISGVSIVLDDYQPVVRSAGLVLKRIGAITEIVGTQDPKFEAAVSLSASLLEELLQKKYHLHSFFIGDESVDIPMHQVQSDDFDGVFDALAVARTSAREPFSKSNILKMADEMRSSGIVFLVLLHFNDAISKFIDEIESMHVPVMAFLVTDSAERKDVPSNVRIINQELLLNAKDIYL